MKTIAINNQGINNERNGAQKALETLSVVLSEIKKHNLLTVKSMAQLVRIASEGEAAVKSIIAEELPNDLLILGVFKLKRRAAVDLLDLPDLTTLNEAISTAYEWIYYAKYLQLEKGALVLPDSSIKEISESNSIIAKSKDEVKMIEAHEAAAKALNDLALAFKAVYGAPIIDPEIKLNYLFYAPNEVDGLKVREYFYSIHPLPRG